MTLEQTKTDEIIKWFEQINQIPRCSKNEGAIRDWLMNWAKENSFAVVTDKVQNLLIKVPASPGYEKSPIVVLQGHLDMVCEKTSDSDHDFTTDPIKLIYEGEWLTADKTTLGADIAFPDWIKYTHAQSYRKQNKFCTPKPSQNKFCTPKLSQNKFCTPKLSQNKFVTKIFLYFIQSGNAI